MNEAALPAQNPMPWVHDDGGRAAAGFNAKNVDDCVCRAIAIATERPYGEVHAELEEFGWFEVSNDPNGRTAFDRPANELKLIRDYLQERGWRWIQISQPGAGFNSRVRLRADELPRGRLIVAISEHVAAVIDGVLHDTYDCSKNGTRGVYGYFSDGNGH